MQPGANRTDIVADPSRAAGQLPADSHGEKAAREAAASAAPVGPQRQAPGPLIRPSQRPNEPVTAGLPVGLGPGPTGQVPRSASTLAKYQALVRKTRDPQLAILVGRITERGR